ncbi:MAG: cysteine desulfurase [Bacilli bacterium]|nr:cysteine desulfurase [Bacilli bacterium]
MIYLDYSATTPVAYDVLESFNKASKDFFANPNSLHKLGIKSKELITSATKQICDIFNCLESEIIYTSGATESNNMAIIGYALANRNKGNHIIVSKLEHPSIYKICDYLSSQGFQIDYVNHDEEGIVDLEDLKKKVNEKTILISVCLINSEMGIRQPLKMIRQIAKKQSSQVVIHSDMTQGLGKVPINIHDVDLASFSLHKVYGPKGIGLLYKNSRFILEPIMYGSSKNNNLRPGTPSVPLIAAASKAIRLGTTDLDRKEVFVKRLNEKIIKKLTSYDDILINKTKYSIPHILNISLKNIKPETFVHAMEEYEIYLGTNTACSSGELSTSVMAIYNDKKRASSTIRISLSYLTTTDEINRFLNYFDVVFKKLNELK